MESKNPVQILKEIVSETARNISDFTKTATAFTRNRKLNAETMLSVTLNMQGNSLNAELLEAFPDIDARMTASAYEQAKDKLKPEVFKHILTEYNKTANPSLYESKYRLFAIDGSDFTTPFNPNSANRIPSAGEKDICQVHANILYDIQNRTYEDCILQPRVKEDERKAAISMLSSLDTKGAPYIVTMDRGYASFNMFENCNRLDGCNYVIRTKAANGAINEIKNLPDAEIDTDMVFNVTTSAHYYMQHREDMPQLHCIQHPKKRHKETYSVNTDCIAWDFGQFCAIKCRVCKFAISDDTYEVIVTNLNRSEFPIEKVKELYHLRWDIETSFRELKYALGGMHFHSKKDDFIAMEIYAHLVMFNAVSRNIAQVSVPQTGHKHSYAVDFKMACLLVRKYFAIKAVSDYHKLLTEILSYINPVRPGRKDKRNMKPKSAVWFVYRVA